MQFWLEEASSKILIILAQFRGTFIAWVQVKLLPSIILFLANAFPLLASHNVFDEIFISQYVEGFGFNKSIELFNGTAETIDLSNYTLEIYSNGKTGDPSRSLNLEGSIESGEVFVVSHGLAATELLAVTDLINNSIMIFNGNDVVALRKNGELIDIIGEIGNSEDFALDIVLIRKANITSGRSEFSPRQWSTNSPYSITGLGEHITLSDREMHTVEITGATSTTVTIIVTGNENQSYQFYSSTDLVNWTLLPGFTGTGAPQKFEFDWSSKMYYKVVTYFRTFVPGSRT